MIPPLVGDETPSPGERELFERFGTDPGAVDWVVLHSLDVPRHRRQVMGEIDFVVAIPAQGVLCLEVKSHRMVRRDADGLWHLGQDPPTRTGPFRQASEGMHSLRDYVGQRAPELRGVLFWSAVCFTHVPFSLTSPAEWHPWQVVDVAALRARPLSELLAAVLANARALVAASPTGSWLSASGGTPTNAQIASIVKILRPSFEFFESPKSRRRQREGELRRFTAEQFDALDGMDPEVNPRVVFEGAAGTGKTLLAIEETRRSILRGERVLLCCFNRLLGTWMRREVEPFGDQVRCSTLHRLLLDVTGMSVPAGAGDSFWSEDLPAATLEVVLAGRFEPFDALIVDEAQDLLQDSYLDVLDVLVIGGLREGHWRLFGDFEKQSIYASGGSPIAEMLSERAPQTPRYRLRKNCRNTPRIASFVTLLAAFERGYPEVLRPDTGVEPEMVYFDSVTAQTTMLQNLLESLYDEGYSGREIVILSPRVDGVATRLAVPRWADRIKPAEAESPGGVRYCTVQAFKGLEAPVVIVTDVSSVGSPDDDSLFYVAITRATERLYVLASSIVKEAVLALLLNRALPGGASD